MTPTIKPNRTVTYHRDGTVSYWSVYRQQWLRRGRISDRELAAMGETERARIQRHIGATQ